VASLGRSRKARVKPASYLGWSHVYSWGLRLSTCLVFSVVDDLGVAMVLGIIILVTPTPNLYSLGLGVVRHVVPYGRSVHSGLVQ
jgi:hypothetical protein